MMGVLQQMLADARPGDTVTAPAGEYVIDALNDDSVIYLRDKSQITLDLTSALVRVQPNAANSRVYFPIGIASCTEINVLLGRVIGDRGTHAGATTMGHGVAIGYGSKKIKLVGGELSDCMGDGVCVFDGEGVECERVVSRHNLRQGFTGSKINGLWAHDCQWLDNGGADPGAGMNLEPDPPPDNVIWSVVVERCLFRGNGGPGFLLACPPERRRNIHVRGDNIFIGKPVDGTDGITPWYAKLLAQMGLGPTFNWFGYKRELDI